MKEEFLPAGMMGWEPPAEVFDSHDGMAPMRWTVPMVYAAMRAGIIYEGARFELFRGQIIQTAQRPTPQYYYIAGVAARVLDRVFGERTAGVRGTLHVSEATEVEPQLLVTRRPREDYTDAHPTPADALLVAEIADDGTREFLLGRKARLYSETGVPEYWVLLPDENAVMVHRQPTAEAYDSVIPYMWGDTIAPLAAPDRSIAVADLLPRK